MEGRCQVSPPFSESWCYEVLRKVRWPNGITCPYCGAKRITTHSKFDSMPRRRYLCLGCRRTFTDLSGTPLARTNLPLVPWFLCLWLIGRGRSTAELARDLGVKWDTAAHMQRRLVIGLSRPGIVRRLRETMETVRASSSKSAG